MKSSPLAPRHHLLVCVNARADGDPLGKGCAGHGESVYHALKQEVGRRGLTAKVWVTRTYCLGHCPKRGATVACQPEGRFFVEVEAADVPTLWQNVQLP